MENQVLITEIIIFLNIFKLAQMKTPVCLWDPDLMGTQFCIGCNKEKKVSFRTRRRNAIVFDIKFPCQMEIQPGTY
jgi:hypothetical protein